MTEPERVMTEISAILTGYQDICHCGAHGELNYEPGATTIECPKCGTKATEADFNPEKCLREWRVKTN